MRALLTMLALAWALVRVYRNGNYKAVRAYVWAMLGHTLSVETYLLFGQRGDLAYLLIYGVTTAAILALAWRVGQRALTWLPKPLQNVVANTSLIQSLFAAVLFGIPASRPALLLALTAALLSIPGVRLLSSACMKPSEERQPFLTLGLLWVIQALVFYVYAAGMPIYPQGWQAIGEWLPALLVTLAMTKLGFDFPSPTTIPASVER